MKQNRKAELQRKLSMMPVPRPPRGLADRLKEDIPDDLAAVTSRGTRSTARFLLPIAASTLIAVAATAFVALYVLRGRESNTALLPSAAPRRVAMPVAAKPSELPEAEVTVSVAEAPRANDALHAPALMAESKRVEPRQEDSTANRVAESATGQFAPTVVAANVRADAADKKSAEQKDEGAVRGAIASGTLGGAALDRPSAAMASAPPPAAPAVKQQASQSAANGLAASRGAERKETQVMKAAVMPAAPVVPREMFGISMDPEALGRVQKTIESGRRPAAASVDVEAIVSYLASKPGSPSSGVSFDVEASREPDVVDSRAAMIRFTIDTAHAPSQGRSIGSDAKLEIRFDEVAVASYRILGNARPLTLREPLLFDNASVTGVIEITLNSGLSPHRDVATLKLHYRDANGRSHTIPRIVRVNDLQSSWEMASFRHRLATLGAIWSESIKGGAAPRPAEVARTAHDLATEAPRDTRARDLADVAKASSQLDGSGSAGSGLR